jgi:MoxR-like ATPase
MEIKKVIIGQKHMIESLLIGLLSNGHILLEGVPSSNFFSIFLI